MGQLLATFPQYKLADLESMSHREFIYLVGAMLDLTAPQATEPEVDRVSRAMRGAHERAHARAVQRAQARRI